MTDYHRRHILHLAIGLIFSATMLIGVVRDSYAGGCSPDGETQWSKYKACTKQYDDDSAKCRALPEHDKELRANCWASASNRLGECNKSKGKVLDKPALITK